MAGPPDAGGMLTEAQRSSERSSERTDDLQLYCTGQFRHFDQLVLLVSCIFLGFLSSRSGHLTQVIA